MGMRNRVRLSNKDIDEYEIRLIRIFKNAKAEKLNPGDKLIDKLYDYRVGDYRFKMDHSEYIFTVFYKKDDETKERRFSCNNEDNVVERVGALVKRIITKS